MKRFPSVVAVICAFAMTTPAAAAILNYDVHLDGNVQQVPVNGSPGVGEAFLALDDVANTLNINLTYSGLTSPATNAHIHSAPPGTNGPVIIPFVPAGFVTGLASGSFIASLNLTALQVADILSGDTYINIHTPNFPGGEIRGNITAATLVPEPASLCLFVQGLLGLAFGWRRLTV